MNIEQTREKYKKYINIGLVAVAVIIVTPIVYTLISGLIGLAIAGIIGLTIVNLAPVLSMKFANWKVSGIVSEATENPIQTMVNLLQAKKVAFAEFENSVVGAVAAEKSFAQKCRDFTKKYPARAAEFNSQLAAMQDLVQKKLTALNIARDMLVECEHKLEEMTAYFSMANAAQAANSAAGMDIGDMYAKLKADTASQAVLDRVNLAFAELEVASSLNQPSLGNDQGQQFNFTNVISTTKVVV